MPDDAQIFSSMETSIASFVAMCDKPDHYSKVRWVQLRDLFNKFSTTVEHAQSAVSQVLLEMENPTARKIAESRRALQAVLASTPVDPKTQNDILDFCLHLSIDADLLKDRKGLQLVIDEFLPKNATAFLQWHRTMKDNFIAAELYM